MKKIKSDIYENLNDKFQVRIITFDNDEERYYLQIYINNVWKYIIINNLDGGGGVNPVKINGYYLSSELKDFVHIGCGNKEFVCETTMKHVIDDLNLNFDIYKVVPIDEQYNLEKMINDYYVFGYNFISLNNTNCVFKRKMNEIGC